jgi:hypothetical protein
MTWKTKLKSLDITSVTPHPSSTLHVNGQAPTISTLGFTPLELFGAIARCSHLKTVDPALVTPESMMIAAMLELHVDDTSNNFAILASADKLKDFVKSYFAGSVASGLAYLTMIRDGYVWADHFENIRGGNPLIQKSPDFAFAAPLKGIALMESKGSRSARLSAFDARVSDGYTDQVEPHLGHLFGSMIATHGYCIGAWLQSTSKAEVRVHHTAVTIQAKSKPPLLTGLSAIQRGNYATAFALSHSDRLGAQINGTAGDYREDIFRQIPFISFDWRGRTWLTSYVVGNFRVGPGYFRDRFYEFRRYRPDWFVAGQRGPSFAFAIESGVAVGALRTFLGLEAREGPLFDVERLIPDGVMDIGYEGGGFDGAVFPDGLAILSRKADPSKVRPVVWNRSNGVLHPA